MVNIMNDNSLLFTLSDTFPTFTGGQDIVGLSDEIRVSNQQYYVSAYIERDGYLLVERIEKGDYVLPRDVISKGETPQDALFRILRTKYGVEVLIGDSIDLCQLGLPILNINDRCYKVVINSDVSPKNLKWMKIVANSKVET